MLWFDQKVYRRKPTDANRKKSGAMLDADMGELGRILKPAAGSERSLAVRTL